MEYTVQNTHGRLLGKKVLPSQRGAQICLERGELFRPENGQGRQTVEVIEGRVWLTRAGGADVILEKGQAYPLDEGGMILIEGLPAGRIRLA